MKSYMLIGTTLISLSMAEAIPEAHGRELSSAWGGTAPSAACKFKSLAELFPSDVGAIIQQTQTEKWNEYNPADRQLPEADIAYGTYERSLTDGSIIKQAAAASDTSGAANSVGYYYFAYVNGQWKKVVDKPDTSVDSNTEVLVQDSTDGSSFGEEQYRFRGTTNEGGDTFTAQTDGVTRDEYTDKKILEYGQQEQIPKSDLVFGVASVCTRRGTDATADGDDDADSDDIFVWATYTFPAFNYGVTKDEDTVTTTMGPDNYNDDNNEIVFVYGNQPQSAPVTAQSLSTITLSANAIEAKCQTAITWSDDHHTESSMHPEKCWITGTVEFDETDPDPNHSVKEGCKAGATMQCEVFLNNNLNTQPEAVDHTVISSVAVLQFVKLYTSTKPFPYSNYESFLDDAPTDTGFIDASWYVPKGLSFDADPFTVLGAKSTETTFSCDTTAYSATKVYCTNSLGYNSQTGLGVDAKELVSTWPSADTVYPTVYVSMIAQVELYGELSGRFSNGAANDNNGTIVDDSDSDIDGGTIKTLQDDLAILESNLDAAHAAYDAAELDHDASSAAYATALANSVAAQAARYQCAETEGSGVGKCLVEIATDEDATLALGAAQNELDAAVIERNDEEALLNTAQSNVDSIEMLIQEERAAHNTRRRLVLKKETVLKKTIITGQHYGKHQQK